MAMNSRGYYKTMQHVFRIWNPTQKWPGIQKSVVFLALESNQIFGPSMALSWSFQGGSKLSLPHLGNWISCSGNFIWKTGSPFGKQGPPFRRPEITIYDSLRSNMKILPNMVDLIICSWVHIRRSLAFLPYMAEDCYNVERIKEEPNKNNAYILNTNLL